MIAPRLVLCSGAASPEVSDGREILELDAIGHNANVTIRLENISRKLLQTLRPRHIDLIEIASYVYAADAAVRRGSEWRDDGATEPWSRDFHFVIPVRDLTFWQQQKVNDRLCEVLEFLSDDTYKFEFVQLTADRPVEQYLELNDDSSWPFIGPDRVLMFSGGLDSLAGAAETAARGENLVLVSHRSVSQLSSRQKRLLDGLNEKYPEIKILHIPVWVNKSTYLGREHTQRTRSFLFCALGYVVADSMQANGVRFFENGVVSLNLPLADEVLRSRASRTTHPWEIKIMSDILCMVSERDFTVDNPFIFLTKKEVVEHLVAAGAAQLIAKSCSCTHTMHQSKAQNHCGTCSQCIDRRIAIMAADQTENDPVTDYVSDVFLGPRKNGYEQNVAVDYYRLASELAQINDVQFATRFNLELSRATRPFLKRGEAAKCFIQMHERHAATVVDTVTWQLKEHVTDLIKGRLEPTSMLALAAGQRHLEPSWRRYCDRIVGILTMSIPTLCRGDRPENEPELQRRCDAVLATHGLDLVREYPFLRWGSVSTKPDWSSPEALRVWVEMKYVRKKADVARIQADIAEDITKYGDNGRRVLFVVYDPQHLVDEAPLSEAVLRRSEMVIRFIR